MAALRERLMSGRTYSDIPWSGNEYQDWCRLWARECLRVLKPGGHLLAFGGTRTWHRLTCAIEDGGFEIRDTVADLTGVDGPGLMWVYGQGFPKNHDVSKAIDKNAGAEREVIGEGARFGRGARQARTRVEMGYRPSEVNPDGGVVAITEPATEDAARWEGWGTALKPAWEPIVVARKPLAGTVAASVLEHGTGALNIDACRVATGPDDDIYAKNPHTHGGFGHGDAQVYGDGKGSDYRPQDGRWPPNVLLGEEAAAVLDRQGGASVSRIGHPRASAAPGTGYGMTHTGAEYADAGGASRFFPVFRYEPKAPAHERPRGEDGSAHPTVKPVDLMRWLVRLVTPPGGLVLDPFAGSGTTAEACIVHGFRCVLVEKDEASCRLIRKRLRKPIQPDLFGAEVTA